MKQINKQKGFIGIGMIAAIIALLLLVGGTMLFSKSKGSNQAADNNASVQSDAQSNVDVQSGQLGLDFSVPAELPVAFVGKPFEYSITVFGGRAPYKFEYEYNKIAYDGSDVYGQISGFPYGKENDLLGFTPEKGQEGEYKLKICARDYTGTYSYNPICKNTKLYIMSDVVKVKGDGNITSSVVWVPGVFLAVRGRAGNIEKKTDELASYAWIPVSQTPSVNLSASIPPKDTGGQYSLGSSGGANAKVDLIADATSVSILASGDAPCGSPHKDGTFNWLNMDSFQVLRETSVGLNIINDGTTEIVVDISLTGKSAISSDSKLYDEAGVKVYAFIGDYIFTLNQSISGAFPLKPGGDITDSKIVRVIVAPGSHTVSAGGINASLSAGGNKGCPSHASVSGALTVKTSIADQSDGKKPAWRMYYFVGSTANKNSTLQKIE